MQQSREERVIPRASIEGRNTRESTLIIIDNVVYDVTEFLVEHPGGPDVLLDNGGRDASDCFRDVGHSDIALEWRKQFRVGVVPEHERRAERAPPPPPPRQESPRALLAAAAPPLALALLAAVLYLYLL